MKALELKVPPPAVAGLIAAGMWGLSLVTPEVAIPATIRVVGALALALAGGMLSMAGARRFRRANTTVNPMRPQATSALVTGGVYGFTRNPMYLGVLLVVVGWAVFLSSPWTLLGPLAFALYIDRFQIVPEERALSALFGAEYTSYRSRVRRWL